MSCHPEYPLLADGRIRVTTARVVFGHDSYSVGAITSVAPFTVPAKRAHAILAAAMSVMCTALAVVVGVWIAPAFAILAAAIAFAAGAYAFNQKAQHGLTIATPDMRVRALTSPDYFLVARVQGAINEALSMR